VTLGEVAVSSLSEGAMSVFKNTGGSRSCSDVVNPMDRSDRTDRSGQSGVGQGGVGQDKVG
jgi:hypothetical protein